MMIDDIMIVVVFYFMVMMLILLLMFVVSCWWFCVCVRRCVLFFAWSKYRQTFTVRGRVILFSHSQIHSQSVQSRHGPRSKPRGACLIDAHVRLRCHAATNFIVRRPNLNPTSLTSVIDSFRRKS
jgi:hypothetical protein